MNICEKAAPESTCPASAIAERLFGSIDECAPLMVIVDRDGKSYPSDISVFEKVFTDSDEVISICARIADGQDILTTQLNGYTIFASQISVSEPTYAMIAVSGQQSGVVCDMAEVMFGQINVISDIIEDQISCYTEPLDVLGNSYICN